MWWERGERASLSYPLLLVVAHFSSQNFSNHNNRLKQFSSTFNRFPLARYPSSNHSLFTICISPIIHLICPFPTILHNFNFPWLLTVFPENFKPNFLGTNKVCYSKCANSEYIKPQPYEKNIIVFKYRIPHEKCARTVFTHELLTIDVTDIKTRSAH